MSNNSWHFYVIRTVDGYLYAGITTDVQRRFKEHATGKGARFFSAHKAKEVVLLLPVGERSLALRVESGFKSLTKAAKEHLIKQEHLIIEPETGCLRAGDSFTI